MVQPTASRGLRSTRATARHLEISDGGTSNVSEPESLRKTHLTREEARITDPLPQYTVPVKFVSNLRVHVMPPGWASKGVAVCSLEGNLR